MKIRGSTKVTGIFGDPVEHSVSPAMHNAAFGALGLDMVYVPFLVRAVPAGELAAAVRAVKALNMRGVNITIPHKERILKYLDSVDREAGEIGAVNTVVNRGGVLTGHNTDGPGYLLSLRRRTGLRPDDRSVIIYGAGGAARAISFSILAAGAAALLIVNRTAERAEALASDLARRFPSARVEAAPAESSTVREFIKRTDLVINATPLGMKGKGVPEIPIEELPEGAVVSDIVYNPLETELIRMARARGLRTLDGLSMLVKQGAITFELWTGRKAPLEVMREAAERALAEESP